MGGKGGGYAESRGALNKCVFSLLLLIKSSHARLSLLPDRLLQYRAPDLVCPPSSWRPPPSCGGAPLCSTDGAYPLFVPLLLCIQLQNTEYMPKL